MIEMIKAALNQVGAEVWSVEEEKVSTAELFFIRRSLDMRRMKKTTKYGVRVYRDFEKDGKKMRGTSMVTIVPSQTEEEVLAAVQGAWFAASFVANPYYELPGKQVAEPITMESDLTELPVEEAAMKMAEALFSAEKSEEAVLNSAEIFAEKVTRHLYTAAGTDVCYTKHKVQGEFVAQCKVPEDVEMHHTFAYDRLDCEALKQEAEKALTQVIDRANAEKTLKSGTYDLILSDKQVATVLSYYLSRSSVGMIYPGYSTWKVGTDVQEKMGTGERLKLTLHATVPYSDEGIPMEDRTLIDEGRVAVLHGNARISCYLGVPATGSYDAMICENGSVSMEEMKKEPYLYAVSFSDFQMDSMSGYFGGEIRLAYYFDGEKVHRVTGGSVNGSINDCCGELVFSKERYDSEKYHGPYAVRMPGIKVAGTV